MLKIWAWLKKFNATSRSVMGYLGHSGDSFYGKFLYTAAVPFHLLFRFFLKSFSFCLCLFSAAQHVKKLRILRREERLFGNRGVSCQSCHSDHCLLWWECFRCMWSQDVVSAWFLDLNVCSWLLFHYLHRAFPCFYSTKCLRLKKKKKKKWNWSQH